MNLSHAFELTVVKTHHSVDALDAFAPSFFWHAVFQVRCIDVLSHTRR